MGRPVRKGRPCSTTRDAFAISPRMSRMCGARCSTRIGCASLRSLPLVEGAPRLGPPVAGIGKILGVGLNYRSHAEETGATPGSEPLVFSKAITALSGPNDPIVIPRDSLKTDWEVELAVVIGAKAQYVQQQHALDHVAGYAVIN